MGTAKRTVQKRNGTSIGAFLRFLFTLRFSFGAAPSYSIDLKACHRLLFKAPGTHIGVSTAGAGLLQ